MTGIESPGSQILDPFGAERSDQKFKAAWNVFAMTCGMFMAPEPSYQAWFAHYLISQYGIDRIAREPVIHIRPLPESPFKARFTGSELRPDVVVTKAPGIMMPHYANRLAKADDETGIGLLGHLSVISELKVAATQTGGLDFKAVCKDIDKLRFLLDAHRTIYPRASSPVAYLCILDNHPRRKKFRFEEIQQLAHHDDPLLKVEVLYSEAAEVPNLPDDGVLRR
ncbi:hypothetical protein OK351_08155 [Glutamicibacter sp. MNS18]|uniref:hypothetical protein n=1 Tax=Glutamicibacter sp. MNS18 TaxID=2989817 RepID=UPI002235E3B0|nr:hypothetical protein [Glutamicibacter sp. MNS18]MCW4465473.1 hypothetical protein [Glutamicibacter sp. MNS18]